MNTGDIINFPFNKTIDHLIDIHGLDHEINLMEFLSIVKVDYCQTYMWSPVEKHVIDFTNNSKGISFSCSDSYYSSTFFIKSSEQDFISMLNKRELLEFFQ